MTRFLFERKLPFFVEFEMCTEWLRKILSNLLFEHGGHFPGQKCATNYADEAASGCGEKNGENKKAESPAEGYF